MILSMTGFGKAEVSNQEKKISLEIKSLNSKQADISVRMPNVYNEREMDIRSRITKSLKRGKIFLQINTEYLGNTPPVEINTKLAVEYIKALQNIETQVGVKPSSDYLSTVTRMPDVVKSKNESISKEEFEMLMEVLEESLISINKFRINEGEILEKDFKYRIETILNLLEEVKPFEEKRTEKIRDRIHSEIEKLDDSIKMDDNRLEQEIIFYLEKLDITEEKIRLKKHCDYFMETLDNPKDEKGKKLGFVCQEIGREINTLGSKANDAAIQKIVVQMKDELEKIKEQMLNIL